MTPIPPRALPWLTLILLFLTCGRTVAQTLAQRAEPFTLTQVWKLDATYIDRQHGVTFRYPSSWEATTQFAYVPPALTVSDAKPISGFGYSEGGFPRSQVVGPYSNTTLEGFGIVYSAVPAASAAECEAEAASLSHWPKRSKVTFGHRSFSVYDTGDEAMNQSTGGELYATFVASTCYLFETDVALVSPEVVEDLPVLTSRQARQIDTHLLEIMKSVRIVPTVPKTR